jgi:hypothetical protein
MVIHLIGPKVGRVGTDLDKLIWANFGQTPGRIRVPEETGRGP